MPQSPASFVRRKKRRKKRSVFIVGRPTQIARSFNSSFSSDGKFPLLHWGLFLVNYRHADIGWKRYLETRDPSDLPPRGTLFELVRVDNDKCTHDKIEDIGLEDWEAEWRYVSIRYIGETEVSDRYLTAKGETQMFCIYLQ